MAYFDCNFDIDLGLSFDQAKSKTQEEFKTELLDSFESKKGDFLEYIKGLGGQGDAIAYSSISFSSTYASWSFGIQGIDDFSLYGNFVFTSGEKLTSYCAGHWNLSYQGNGLPPLVVDFLQGDEVTISEIEEGSVDISLPPSDEQIASQNLATAQAQQAQYMDWLNNSAYIANLRTQMNLDSNFYFVEDHGITDNEFWYTFETGYYTETGVTNVQETQPFTPSDIGGSSTVDGNITVNIDWGTAPTIPVDIQELANATIGLSLQELEEKKLLIDTSPLDEVQVPISIPVGTTLDVNASGGIDINTDGKYIVVNTDGLAIPIENPDSLKLPVEVPSTAKIPLEHDLPESIQVNDSIPNTINVEGDVALNTTGKTVELDITNKNIPLDTTDKTVELDVANKNVTLDTSDASVEMTTSEDSPVAKIADEMKRRNDVELGGIRQMEYAVAAYQDSLNKAETSEKKDRIGRELEAYEQQFNKETDETGMAKGHFGRLKNAGYYQDKTFSLYNGMVDLDSKGEKVETVKYTFGALKDLNEQFGFTPDYDVDFNSEFDEIAEIFKKTVSKNEMNSKPETVVSEGTS